MAEIAWSINYALKTIIIKLLFFITFMKISKCKYYSLKKEEKEEKIYIKTTWFFFVSSGKVEFDVNFIKILLYCC